MEIALLTTLLGNESVSWVGWLLVVSVALGFGIAMLTKSINTIVKNVKALKKELKRPDYKKQIKCENSITEVMRTIKHDLFADRVLVIQYHNGVYSIANNSLLKMSVTHETLDRGVKSAMQMFQNIPSNYLGNWNTQLFEGRYIELPVVADNEKTTEQRGVIEFLKDSGVKSVYLFPIEDSMGNTFGMGMVQYLRKEYELDANYLRWAMSRFHGIGALLAGPGEEK